MIKLAQKPLSRSLTAAIAMLAITSLTGIASADHHEKSKAADELGRELAELNRAAETMVSEAEKTQERANQEVAASQKVLGEAKKVLADAEKALIDAQARQKVAEENAHVVSSIRNTIRQANESAQRQLAGPKKVDSPTERPAPKAAPAPAPQPPKKAEPKKAEAAQPAAKK